jgi:hypothetical protein
MNQMSCSILAAALAVGTVACTGAESADLATGEQALLPVGAFMTLDNVFGSILFRPQIIGTIGAPQALTLKNSGTADLTLTALTLTGLNPGDFAIDPSTTTCAVGTVLTTLAPSCVLGVTSSPTLAGVRSARLTIGNNAEGTPHSIPLTGFGTVAGAAIPGVGPIDLRHGYPAWYQSAAGVRLQPCLLGAQCISPVPNPAAQPLVADVGSNFPPEIFYWHATSDASLVRNNGQQALLVLALEGAFSLGEIPAPGDQVVFARVRVRIKGLNPNTNYTITHPLGQKVIRSEADGTINSTSDIGCAGTPCDFSQVLTNNLLTSFPKWDPAFGALAPVGYLGNPNVNHRIIGAPAGAANNLFRINGPNVNPGSATPNVLLQRLFFLGGELVP